MNKSEPMVNPEAKIMELIPNMNSTSFNIGCLFKKFFSLYRLFAIFYQSPEY